MSKYSQWFPPRVKPVHVGVYQTWFVSPMDGGFSKWDGKKWLSEMGTVARADKDDEIGNQKKYWRGLAVKP